MSGQKTSGTRTLYEELGGAESIAVAVDRFYDRVLADMDLAPSFIGVDVDQLRRSQRQYLSKLTGGPDEYHGRSMSDAHRDLMITMYQFERVAIHLKDTLVDLGVPERLVNAVMGAVGPLSKDIVTKKTTDHKSGGKQVMVPGTLEATPNGIGSSLGSNEDAKVMQDLRGQVEAIKKSQAVIEFNLDGTIITANDNFLGAVGYSLAEIQGKHHSLFVEDSYKNSADYRQFWEKLGRGEYVADRFKRIGKGGKEIWIQASYNPIMDVNGRPFKVVKYATDITKQVAFEREMALMKPMLENAPVNVIMADKDLNITYMNPASLRTLQTLKQYLPVPPEKVVGANVDIFHKNPAYQRKILSNPASLPVRAIIQIGPEKADLLVSAINDDKGIYIGPMVTWEVVTDKLKLAADAARVQAMVENAPVNVIMADKDLNITYMNPASLKTLQTLKQYLPVPPEKVVGSNVDIFHKNPAYQRKILANPASLPIQATIQIGPEKADLLVSAINDDKGNYIGPMVTWSVVTEKLKLENDAARIQSMVENVPINIIMADTDLNITYMNPASLKTLQTLKQYLPVPPEKVVGSNVDIFHKNPTHQRKILSDPNNLPHQANIQIGPEMASLQVSAILDKKGAYIGPMVTWEVITERMRVERDIAETSKLLEVSSASLTNINAQMSANAEETSAQANVVAAAAEQVSKNIETVATAAEEMSASIKEISSNTTEAAKIAGEAVRVAEATNTNMAKLEKSSAEIGQVIKVITSIAQQTNLLALNATIEAARAGEAGKGFAVVANEVKELAKQTAKATEDIGQRIETIQGDTRGAVEAIGQISGIIGKINDIQNTIAGAVEEQTATTNEIGRNVAEASKGSAEIAQNIAGVAQAAKDTTQGATSAQTSSSELFTKLASVFTALLKK